MKNCLKDWSQSKLFITEHFLLVAVEFCNKKKKAKVMYDIKMVWQINKVFPLISYVCQ